MLPLAVIAGLTRNILTTYRSLLRNITCCLGSLLYLKSVQFSSILSK